MCLQKQNPTKIWFELNFPFCRTWSCNVYESNYWNFHRLKNRTNHHDITEILLKVALSTINQTKPTKLYIYIISIFNDFFPVIGRSRCGEKLKKIIEIFVKIFDLGLGSLYVILYENLDLPLPEDLNINLPRLEIVWEIILLVKKSALWCHLVIVNLWIIINEYWAFMNIKIYTNEYCIHCSYIYLYIEKLKIACCSHFLVYIYSSHIFFSQYLDLMVWEGFFMT